MNEDMCREIYNDMSWNEWSPKWKKIKLIQSPKSMYQDSFTVSKESITSCHFHNHDKINFIS